MATSWLTATYQSFIRTHAMFEKYNVTTLTEEASAGGGGEYEVQVSESDHTDPHSNIGDLW